RLPFGDELDELAVERAQALADGFEGHGPVGEGATAIPFTGRPGPVQARPPRPRGRVQGFPESRPPESTADPAGTRAVCRSEQRQGDDHTGAQRSRRRPVIAVPRIVVLVVIARCDVVVDCMVMTPIVAASSSVLDHGRMARFAMTPV